MVVTWLLQLTIGRLARIIGVNLQTVRYYERLKLLGPSMRTPFAVSKSRSNHDDQDL